TLFFTATLQADDRPNILFFFADDWGRYASAYADPDQPSLNDVIDTPHLDRIANEGVLFHNAFVPVASCGPCRASLATGRYFWNCGSGAFLNGKASNWEGHDNPFTTLPKFVDGLRDSGYFVQRSRKTFAFTQSRSTPAMKAYGQVPYERYGLYVGTAANETERQQRHDEVVENSRREMERILVGTPEDQPFFFVFGSINVHRPYTPDSGKELWGIEPDSLKGLIPDFLPDTHDVRRDFSDYLGEVQAIDLMLGAMLEELEKAGELDNTLVILSGDHGIPGVPRGKTNCYDLATRVSLMARLPGTIPAGRTVEDFVSVMDIGPTLLDLAGAKIPESMDGVSFRQQLTSDRSGWIDKSRDRVIIGRELHFHDARPGNLPYPMRAIRSKDFLYIHNFKPDRWPMGAPSEIEKTMTPKDLYEMGLSTVPSYRDLDGSLTKAWLMGNDADPVAKRSVTLTLGKRPAEELYDLHNDPDQLTNLVDNPEYADQLAELRAEVNQIMGESHDPRLTDALDAAPWVAPELVAPGNRE
ncbi:MAG: sulfatase, partial [Verrucomicrobiales bacterium]|nr:sulfatase [Verrucomicrobiales bacterium]